jgi:hypothetical protein
MNKENWGWRTGVRHTRVGRSSGNKEVSCIGDHENLPVMLRSSPCSYEAEAQVRWILTLLNVAWWSPPFNASKRAGLLMINISVLQVTICSVPEFEFA